MSLEEVRDNVRVQQPGRHASLPPCATGLAQTRQERLEVSVIRPQVGAGAEDRVKVLRAGHALLGRQLGQRAGVPLRVRDGAAGWSSPLRRGRCLILAGHGSLPFRSTADYCRNSGILPAHTSFSHSSKSGQPTAHVPKSAMYWYCVSRSIAFCRIARSFRKTRPWLGTKNSASSSRMRLREVMKSGRFEPWWASMTPTQLSL